MANHTPEPWSKNAISPTVYDGDGIAILCCEGRTLIAENESNARRIVACVNACAGIPDEALNDLDGTLNKIKAAIEINRSLALADDARLAAITAQRDELLELLKSSLSELKIFVFNSEWQKSDFPVIARAESAIAKCEVQNG